MKNPTARKLFLRHGSKAGPATPGIDPLQARKLLVIFAARLKATRLNKPLRRQLKAIQDMAGYVLAESADDKQRRAALDAAVYSSAVAYDVESGDVAGAALNGFWAGQAYEKMFLGPWADIGQRQRIPRFNRQGEELRERARRLAAVKNGFMDFRHQHGRAPKDIERFGAADAALKAAGLMPFNTREAFRRFLSENGLSRAN